MLLAALSLYVALCGLVYLAQDRMLFPGMGQGAGAALPALGGVRVEWLARADGSRFRAAVAAAPSPDAVIVFFCGNGEDLRSGVIWAARWRDYGLTAVVAEYPGYGESSGAPSEESIAEMAVIAADCGQRLAAASGVPLVVAGSSLGSFAAVRAAAAGRGDRLLLLAPFTSVLDVARDRFWFLPVRWILRRPFDNLGQAAAVAVPGLVVHGEDDRIIPVALGRRLAGALGGSCRFVPVPGAGHNDLPVGRSGPLGGLLQEFLSGG